MSDVGGELQPSRIDDLEELERLWVRLTQPEVLVDPEQLREVVAEASLVRERSSGKVLVEADDVMDFAWQTVKQHDRDEVRGETVGQIASRAAARAAAIGAGPPSSGRPVNVADARMTELGLARPPGHWRRLGAGIVDILFVIAATYGLILLAGALYVSFFDPDISDAEAERLAFRMYLVALPTAAIVYGTALESARRQATVGKMLFGLIAADGEGRRLSAGRAAGRHVVKIIEIAIFWPILATVFFDGRRRGLHDLAAGTVVFERW